MGWYILEEMKLHRTGKVADWRRTRRGRYNTWQKIAAETGGWITPANILSVGGLLFVAYGGYLLISDDYYAGFLTIVVGRLADLVDGYVADNTGTKSPLGEMIDVVCDKLAIGIVLPILALEGLVPPYIIAAIVAQNLVVGIISLLGRGRAINLHPNQEGKLSVAASWVAVIAFALANSLPGSGWEALHTATLCIAISSSIIFAISGTLALIKYAGGLQRPTKPGPSQLPKFTRIILVVNPTSSHVSRVRGRARELKTLFPARTIEVVETTKDPLLFRTKLTSRLSENSRPTLLCIGGGDGTVNLVLNILMKGQHELRLDHITLLPLWGGNANDFAYMLNGPPGRTKLKSLFALASVVPVHPFQITLTSPDKTVHIRYAACYASFGASAYATDQLDKTVHHNKKITHRPEASRFLAEVLRSFKALLDAPGFDIELRGRRVKIFEHVFINGPRVAKLSRMPVKLNEKKFYQALRPEQEPFFMFYMRLFQIFKRGGYNAITSKPQTFTTEQKVWAQFDGEAMELPAHTTITVQHAATPFYALSKKLKP